VQENSEKIKSEAYLEKWTKITRKIPESKCPKTNVTKIGTISSGTFLPGDKSSKGLIIEGLIVNASLLASASTSSEKSYVFAVGYKRSKNYIHTDLRYLLIYVYCTENPIYVFPEMKLRGLVPSSFIHVSVSDFIFPGSICLFGCSKIGRLILGIYKSLRDT
jgi:hypothetical protein